MEKNTFKQKLVERHLSIGLWLGLASAYSAEIVAAAGFDFLVIDGEHSPNDLRSILAQLQAIAPYPAQPVVRPPCGDTVLIKQLLDIGVQTLLVPMVDHADQARTLVAAVRYPPLGVRGVGSVLARASRWGLVDGYMQQADAQMCLLVQAESHRALENLESIVAVEGVDGVFIGSADLAASMGYPGNPAHPEVVAAIERAIVTISNSGKAAGILSLDETQAKRYIDLGACFVAVGVDTGLLAQAAFRLASHFSVSAG